MSEWKEYKLGEICKVKGGKRLPKGNNLTTIPNSHPYIRVRDMGEKYLPINNLEYVPNEVFPSIKNYIVDKGDLILSIVGSVGLVSLVNENLDKASLTENCVKILPQKDILNNEFLYYFLISNFGQAEIYKKTVGAVQPKLPIYNINDIELNLPNLQTQTAIAEILSSLDDKIELNNKINYELETLAQTLFKQWFIDFEFPNEKGKPYKSSGGEMVDSELGEIPKGWKVNRLNDIVDCFDNKRVPLSSMERNVRKGIYPYYGAASLMDYIDDYLFDGVYILMGEDGSVTDNIGYPVLQYVFGKFWVNNHAHVLKGRKISTELVLCLLKNTNISDLVTGAVQPKLNQGNMNKISIPLPNNLSIISDLEKLITEYYNLFRNNILEIKELISIRDNLLPKLISGELEINEINN